MGARRGGLPEFEWDEHHEDKLLERHNVSALEAEQCFGNPSTRRREGAALLLLGVTDGGRMLFVVYVSPATQDEHDGDTQHEDGGGTRVVANALR